MDRRGRTPLHWAAQVCHFCHDHALQSMVKDMGTSSLWAVCCLQFCVLGPSNKACLCVRGQHGCSNTVDLLLRSGANVHAKALDGKTALSLAMENRHNELVQKLLARQSQPEPSSGGNQKSNGRVTLSAQQPLPVQPGLHPCLVARTAPEAETVCKLGKEAIRDIRED